LTDESKCDCLALKGQLKKTEKSIKLPILFLVFFDSIYVVLILFLFPIWDSAPLVYSNLALGFLTLGFWLRA